MNPLRKVWEMHFQTVHIWIHMSLMNEGKYNFSFLLSFRKSCFFISQVISNNPLLSCDRSEKATKSKLLHNVFMKVDQCGNLGPHSWWPKKVSILRNPVGINSGNSFSAKVQRWGSDTKEIMRNNLQKKLCYAPSENYILC